MKTIIPPLVIALLALCSAGAVAQYDIPHGVFSNGGGVHSGGSYIIYNTAGQTAISGISDISGSYRVKSGFWYMAEISSTVEIALTSFDVNYSDDRVKLSWTTAKSAHFDGFNIYRREGEEGLFERINAELLTFASATDFCDETAMPGNTYSYQIGAVQDDNEIFSRIVTLSLPPKPLTLYQNHPNPFNPSTTIGFFLPRNQRVNLTIYDIEGRRVKTLIDGHQNAGRQDIIWNGTNDNGRAVSSGVYYYRLVTGKKKITRKMVVIR